MGLPQMTSDLGKLRALQIETNQKLDALLRETQRTNQLIEWLAQVIQQQPEVSRSSQ